MRRLVWIPALAGALLVWATPSWGQAVGPCPGHPAACPTVVGIAPASAACGHQPGCGHQSACGSGPCATFAQPSTDPLPCITLSRYADDGDYDCVKRVYGDGYPHFPRYWFRGQRYPLPHDYSSGGTGGGGGGGSGGGRGVGIGGR